MTAGSMFMTLMSFICMLVGALHILTEGGNIEIGCTMMIIGTLMLIISELQDIRKVLIER